MQHREGQDVIHVIADVGVEDDLHRLVVRVELWAAMVSAVATQIDRSFFMLFAIYDLRMTIYEPKENGRTQSFEPNSCYTILQNLKFYEKGGARKINAYFVAARMASSSSQRA